MIISENNSILCKDRYTSSDSRCYREIGDKFYTGSYEYSIYKDKEFGDLQRFKIQDGIDGKPVVLDCEIKEYGLKPLKEIPNLNKQMNIKDFRKKVYNLYEWLNFNEVENDRFCVLLKDILLYENFIEGTYIESNIDKWKFIIETMIYVKYESINNFSILNNVKNQMKWNSIFNNILKYDFFEKG